MQLIEFIETLPVVQGSRIGNCMKIMPWQRKLLKDVTSKKYHTIALSLGRGNGKSCLMAGVGLWQLMHGPANSDIVLVASSFAQTRDVMGRFLARWASDINEGIADKKQRLKVWNSVNVFEVRCPKTGSRIITKGCDPKRMHGLAPSLVLADEPAQWPEHISRPMYEAISTSLGKIPNAKLCAFSTRPEPGSWFSKLLEGEQDEVAVHLYSADGIEDQFSMQALKAANPSMTQFPTLKKQLITEARQAEQDGGALPSYRAYRLNMPLETGRETIVQLADWLALDHRSARRVGPCYVGLDLGGSDSMTCASAFWPNTGRMEVYSGIGNNPALSIRARRDGLPYQEWKLDRSLWVFAGRVTPVDHFLRRLMIALEGVDVAYIGSDGYRKDEFLDALDGAGCKWPIPEIKRGKHKSRAGGAYDVRAFQRLVLKKDLHVSRGVGILQQSVGRSTIRWDAAGNPALDHKKRRDRIDALSATIIAVGAARADHAGESKFAYQVLPASGNQADIFW